MKRPSAIAALIAAMYGLSCFTGTALAILPAQHDFDIELEGQAQTISAVRSHQDPQEWLDPASKEWDDVSGQDIKLFAQGFTDPEGGGSTDRVSAKAVRLDNGLVVRVAWPDSTRDSGDTAAMEFPVAASDGSSLAMGHAGHGVNILLWKAGSEVKEHSRLPKSSKPLFGVKKEKNQPSSSQFTELVAEGMHNRRTKDQQYQNLQGRAVWKRGQWKVTIFKPFDSGDPDRPDFSAAGVPVAFAIWNGAAGEQGSKKSVSTWTRLQFLP